VREECVRGLSGVRSELVSEGQRSWYLKTLAMLTYPVGERTVEQGLFDLEWGGFLTRTRARDRDKRERTVTLTAKGRRALVDPAMAPELDSLAMRHRQRNEAAYISNDPYHVRR